MQANPLLLPTAAPTTATAPTPTSAPDAAAPRTPQALTADFITALAAALPNVKAAAKKAATALPQPAVGAAKLGAPDKADEETATEPITTPDVIALLMAALALPAKVEPKPAASAMPIPVTLRGDPRRAPASDQSIEPAIASALEIVTAKTPDHASAVEALSAIVADANPSPTPAAPEIIAVPAASAFVVPQIATALPPPMPDVAPAQNIQITVPVPVDHPEWGKAVGDQLVMAVHQGKHSAELRLDPPNLGPVSVQIEVSGNQAKVSFVAPVNATCDALSQSLPDLRNAFSSQGMTLAQANISQQNAQPQMHGGQGGSAHHGHARGSEPIAEVTHIRVITPRGIVDEYA